MNFAMRAASLRNTCVALYTENAFFHSTPVLDRKRRTHWDSGGGSFRNSSKRFNFSRRFRKMHAKQTLLRNVSAYAECLFQSWHSEGDHSDSFSDKGASWFRGQHWKKETKKKGFHSHGSQWESYGGRGKAGFSFCFGEDEDVETILRSAFGGERYFYWSFVSDDDSHSGYSSRYSGNYRNSWNGGNRCEYDYDTYEECSDSKSDSTSEDRLALGLSCTGPLKLEDVKSAYRACALKWHPDRHHGSSKAIAEEKFKLCSAAYQSLCDKLEGVPGASYC